MWRVCCVSSECLSSYEEFRTQPRFQSFLLSVPSRSDFLPTHLRYRSPPLLPRAFNQHPSGACLEMRTCLYPPFPIYPSLSTYLSAIRLYAHLYCALLVSTVRVIGIQTNRCFHILIFYFYIINHPSLNTIPIYHCRVSEDQ